MRKLIIIVPFVVLGIMILSTMASAQQMQMMQHRFEQEYQTTNEVMRRAQEMIAGSGDQRGAELLKIAAQLQTQAHVMGRNQQFENGIKLTLKAREQARAAMMINQQAEENENLVQRQLERTEDLMARVKSAIPQDADNMVESLFNTARENQRRAWEFFYNHQLRPALKLSRQVEKTMSRLAEQLRAQSGDTERLTRQYSRAAGRIESISDILDECGDEKARQMYEEAVRYLERTEQHLNSGELEGAENALRLTNQRLNSINSICLDARLQEKHLSRLKSEIHEISQAVINSGNQRALRLVETAKNHLEKAERFCSEGDAGSCAANLKAAQISLRKAKRLAGL